MSVAERAKALAQLSGTYALNVAILEREAQEMHASEKSSRHSFRELSQACSSLESEMLDSATQLHQLGRRVKEDSTLSMPSVTDDRLLRLRMLKQKRAAFMAEIEQLEKQTQPAFIDAHTSSHPQVLKQECEQELVFTVAQLEDGIQELLRTVDLIQTAIAKEKGFENEHKQLTTALRKQLESESQSADADGLADDTVESRLRIRLRAIEESNEDLESELKRFIRKHYPAQQKQTSLDQHGIKSSSSSSGKIKQAKGKGKRKKRKVKSSASSEEEEDEEEAESDDSNEDDEEEETRSKQWPLDRLLQHLMDLCLNRPESPYLRLDSRKHWMPYVELLVRAGVAVKHAGDSNLVKLVEFHR